MAKGQKRSTREIRKPKKAKATAAAPAALSKGTQQLSIGTTGKNRKG